MINTTRIARFLFPDPPIPEMPPPEEIEKATNRYEEHSRTIRRVFHTLLFTELFCLITLAVPDSQLVIPDAVVELPLLKLKVSFVAFLIVGPVLIIGLTVYLHIFYGDLPQSTFPGIERLSSVYVLFNLNVVAAQLVVWILFYWIPVVVLGVFAWKALPHPTFGHSLVWVTLICALIMVVLQIRRCPATWRKIVVPSCGVGTIVVLIALFVLADSELRLNRKLDLFKVDFSKKDLSDVDLHGALLREAMLAGANLRRANLRGVDLSDASLIEATLENTDLTGASLVGAHLHRSSLTGARLEGANLQYANFGPDKKNSLRSPTLKTDTAADKFLTLPPIPVDIVRQADNWVLAFYHEQTLGHLGLEPMHNQNVREKKLTHMDLANKSLRGADLVGYQLNAAILTGADLTGANLSGANLESADLKRAELTEAMLDDSNLQGAHLHKAKVVKEQLRKAHNWVLARYDMESAVAHGLKANHNELLDDDHRDLTKLKFSQLKLKGAYLEQFNLSGAQLINANLTEAKLDKAKLIDTNLRGANLTEASLREAKLIDTNLRDANLKDAVLVNANLQGAHLEAASLTIVQAKLAHNWVLAHYDAETLARLGLTEDHDKMLMEHRLRGINLPGGNLLNANLSGFDLYKAQLAKADLNGANLNKAFLAFADLRGANLADANLDGANLTGARLDAADLEGASLNGTVLIHSSLEDAVLTKADLAHADIRGARIDCKEIQAALKWEIAVRDEKHSCGKPLEPATVLVVDSIAQQAPTDLLAGLRIQIDTINPRRTKPHINVGTIGHVGHGKTT